jgi:hypothetical protein
MQNEIMPIAMGIENRHQLKLLDDIPMENKANPCAETN